MFEFLCFNIHNKFLYTILVHEPNGIQHPTQSTSSSPGENRGFKLTNAPLGNSIDTNALNAFQQKTTPAHKKKEIYRYTGKDPFYACAWSNKFMGDSFRLAVCTCLDDERFEKNRISILEYDEYKNELVERCNFEHGYPASSMMMNPAKVCHFSQGCRKK